MLGYLIFMRQWHFSNLQHVKKNANACLVESCVRLIKPQLRLTHVRENTGRWHLLLFYSSIINFRVQTHRHIKFTFKLLGSRSLAVDVNDFIVLIY